MTTVYRWTGREAKLLRGALRLSVRDFAAHLGVGVRTVNKWEARQADIAPLPYMQEVLDTALAQASDGAKARFADGILLKRSNEPLDDAASDAVLSASWSQRGTVEASVALSGGGNPVKRRRFTLLTGAVLTAPAHQWLVRDPEPLVSGLSGGRVSAALVNQLPTMIATLRVMDDAAGGGTVLSLAQQAFGWVAELLDHASYDERTGQKLLVALAEVGQLTGWVAHDAGQPGCGQRYHVAALRAAHSADDRPLGAHILGCMADQAARHGQPAEAVTLIETAMAGIRGWETPRLLAELCIRKAYALATMFDDSFARDRQIYLTHLAEALAQPGKQCDLDAAVDRGLAALRLAESLTSSRGRACLHTLCSQMQRHASVPVVDDFLERVRGVLAA